MLFRSAHAPRAFLRRAIDRLFIVGDEETARLLVTVPAVLRAADMLTDLALLPGCTRGYEDTRYRAKNGLRALALILIRDTSVSVRTLFVLAQTLDSDANGVHSLNYPLAAALAEHPKVRQNPAILAILADPYPPLRGQAVAAVPASSQVRDILAAFLEPQTEAEAKRKGIIAFANPAIRTNVDALLLLANMSMSRIPDVVIAASRLLPDTAYRRWAWGYSFDSCQSPLPRPWWRF